MSFISNLPALVTKKESESIYVNLFSTLTLAVDFLSATTNNNDNNILTVFTNKETFLSKLNSHSEAKFSKLTDTQFKTAYFLTKENIQHSQDVLGLSKDIQKINAKAKKNSQHTLLINESMLADLTSQEIESFLYKIKQSANKRGLYITLCLYGHLGMVELESKLLTLNQTIAGLSSMTLLDEQRFSYFVKFWLNSYGVTASEEYILAYNEHNELEATRYDKVQLNEAVKIKSDAHICYISQTAIDQNTPLPKRIVIADSNQHLLNVLDNPQAATIVFSCTSQNEIQELAISSFQLRSDFGNHLKIIIRETQQCLRYTDEKLLLRAGVNLIVPNQVPFPRFMTQVDAIQGQIMNRNLPVSLEALLKYNLKYGNKGYLQSNDFVQYCSSIITRSLYSNVDFSLVKLILLPGMRAEDCLRLCHIKRDGDVVTATNNALYVLFSAIRKTDIDIAINHIFEFPVRDLFHSTTTLDIKEDIEAELRYISENSLEVSDEISSLTTQQQIFSPTAASLTDIPVLFAVKKAILTQEPV